MFWERIFVDKQERVLISCNGKFDRILLPGEYYILVSSILSHEIERHNLRNVVFRSAWADYLIAERPDVLARHFVHIATSETEVGMVYLNGTLLDVLLPAKRLLLWRDAGSIVSEVTDVVADAPDALSCAVV